MELQTGTGYFYTQQGQQQGPVTSADLIALAQNRQLQPSDQIWREGMGNWLNASEFTQLAAIFQPPAAPQPQAPQPQGVFNTSPSFPGSQTPAAAATGSGGSAFLNQTAPSIGVKNRVKVSALAVWAMILGLLSVVASCFLKFSGIFGITLAIWAIIAIKKSDGKLSGMPQAVIGMICGSIGLAIGLFSINVAKNVGLKQAEYEAIVEEGRDIPDEFLSFAFDEAEKFISPYGSKAVAHGNSKEAKAVAKGFSEKMLEIRKTVFSGYKDSTLSGGEFLTYCQMTDDAAVIIFHTPELRKFETDGKDDLSDYGWAVATAELLNIGYEGKTLGVAMKGNALFHRADLGTVLKDQKPGTKEGITNTSDDEDILYPFFRTFKKSEVQ